MRYVSVCSGIEGATVAWHPLGWEAVAFAEIDPFCRAVLKHHYPSVRNLGDFTRIGADDVGAVDLLVGGTPCQDFSVAGLRAGLGGHRGHLTLEFCRLLERLRPRWFCWENVPGVLSQDAGRAFGTFLGLLGDCGYGWAYRVLDAQYFGVPQRRRRVFLVGCLGDANRAAAVLLERASLQGHPPPSSEARQGAASLLASGAGTDRPAGIWSETDFLIPAARALTAHGQRYDAETETLVFTQNSRSEVRLIGGDGATTGAVTAEPGAQCQSYVAHALRADGFDASEDGTGLGIPLVPLAFDSTWSGDVGTQRDGDVPLKDGHGTVPAVAYQCQGTNVGEAGTVRSGNGHLTGGVPFLAAPTAVRRLTPVECARLQGFPDDYLTQVTYRGACPPADGAMYRALGNAFCVPVVAWVGRRIALVEEVAPCGA